MEKGGRLVEMGEAEEMGRERRERIWKDRKGGGKVGDNKDKGHWGQNLTKGKQEEGTEPTSLRGSFNFGHEPLIRTLSLTPTCAYNHTILFYILLFLKHYHSVILALKWRKNLHTSICWRQHFISFLKHFPHLLSINQELLFRYSICFFFFFFLSSESIEK